MMGLFCGKKCKCRRRCKSYFSEQPDLERACRKACSNDHGLNREKFLCSGKYIDEAQYILSYGHDPCPNSPITVEDVLDPTNSYEKEMAWFEEMKPIYLGIGIAILIALGMLVWSIKR